MPVNSFANPRHKFNRTWLRCVPRHLLLFALHFFVPISLCAGPWPRYYYQFPNTFPGFANTCHRFNHTRLRCVPRHLLCVRCCHCRLWGDRRGHGRSAQGESAGTFLLSSPQPFLGLPPLSPFLQLASPQGLYCLVLMIEPFHLRS